MYLQENVNDKSKIFSDPESPIRLLTSPHRLPPNLRPSADPLNETQQLTEYATTEGNVNN